MANPRALTPEEVRDMLLDNMRFTADFWANVEGKTEREKISGALFSVLAMLDGCNIGICAFNLVAMPHEEDKQYHISNGENWIEPGTVLEFMLHEHWYK